MDLNVYVKGNIFFIKDENGILYRAHSKDVLITNFKNSNMLYYFHHVLDWNASTTVKRAEILKEDGSAYTDEEWFVFQTESIGGNNNGGGNGVGLQSYDASKEYKEDAVIIKDDNIYIANDLIPKNTAFAIGTTGATWREISKVSKLETRGSFDTHAIMVANITDPQVDDLAVVETTTGIRFVNQKLSGLWRYNGTEWVRLGLIPTKHGAQAHDAGEYYYEGNLIWHNSKLQRCKADIAPKAYDANDWEDAGGSDFWEATSTDTTTAYIYKGGLNGTAWQINRYDRANGMARTSATVSNNSGTTTLTAAWADRLTINYV